MKRFAPFALVLLAFVVGVWFSSRDAERPADGPAGLAAPPSGGEGGRGDVPLREGPSAAPSDGPAAPAPGEVPTDPAPAESAPPDYDGFVDAAMARLPADLANRDAIAERFKKLLRENPDDPEILAGVVAWIVQKHGNGGLPALLSMCEGALALQPGNRIVRWQHLNVLFGIAGSAEGYTAEDETRQLAALYEGAAAEPDNAQWGIYEAALRLRHGEDPGPVLAGLREALSRPVTYDGFIDAARGHQKVVRGLLEDPAVVHPADLLYVGPSLPGIFQIHVLGRSLSSLAEPHLIAGHWEEAVEVLSLAQEVGVRIRASGVAVHAVVGLSFDRAATRELERLAQMRGDHLRFRHAQERLSGMEVLKRAVGERVMQAEDCPLRTWYRRVNEVAVKYGMGVDASDPWQYLGDTDAMRLLLDRMTPEEREVVLSGADLIFEEHRIVQEILAGAPAPPAGG